MAVMEAMNKDSTEEVVNKTLKEIELRKGKYTPEPEATTPGMQEMKKAAKTLSSKKKKKKKTGKQEATDKKKFKSISKSSTLGLHPGRPGGASLRKFHWADPLDLIIRIRKGQHDIEQQLSKLIR